MQKTTGIKKLTKKSEKWSNFIKYYYLFQGFYLCFHIVNFVVTGEIRRFLTKIIWLNKKTSNLEVGLAEGGKQGKEGKSLVESLARVFQRKKNEQEKIKKDVFIKRGEYQEEQKTV